MHVSRKQPITITCVLRITLIFTIDISITTTIGIGIGIGIRMLIVSFLLHTSIDHQVTGSGQDFVNR